MTGERILVVEDDGLIALYLSELLEKAGYQIIGMASSGEEVLRTLKEFPKPDLILMDIGLAGSLDGIETARQIRQRFSISLIFITAYATGQKLEQMREVTPDGCIIKPFLEEDVLAVIRKAMDRRTT